MTAREIFDTVEDEELRLRLKRALRVGGKAYFRDAHPHYTSLEQAILCAFTWNITNEGGDYWNEVHLHFTSGTDMPPPPDNDFDDALLPTGKQLEVDDIIC